MTPCALLLQACGLSHREAAELLGVRIDTVKSWSAGRNRAPAGVIAELRALHGRIEAAAGAAVRAIEATGAADIEIGYPADDHEARALGLPCVGAWRAMAAIVVARTRGHARLAPRGSTPAGAAAADAHGR